MQLELGQREIIFSEKKFDFNEIENWLSFILKIIYLIIQFKFVSISINFKNMNLKNWIISIINIIILNLINIFIFFKEFIVG